MIIKRAGEYGGRSMAKSLNINAHQTQFQASLSE